MHISSSVKLLNRPVELGRKIGRKLHYQPYSPRRPSIGKSNNSYVGPLVIACAICANKCCERKQVCLEPRKPVTHSWQMYDQLGKGAYGVVKLGMCSTTGEVAAIKMINAKKTRPNVLRREIAALKKIKQLGGHEGIIDLKDVFVQGENICLVTEFVRGGELFDAIVRDGAYKEDVVKPMIRQIGSAIQFMHDHGLIHTDLKPENILLCAENGQLPGSIKVADFGSAVMQEDRFAMNNAQAVFGSINYSPPECLSNRPENKASFEADMWALGCICYILLCGYHPFDVNGDGNEKIVVMNIRNAEISFDHPIWSTVSEDAKSVICQLLQIDPKLRMTASDFVNHPWVSSNLL